MAKELFMEKQQPVRVIADKDLLYVFICLNGKEKTIESAGLNESDNRSVIYIEYDYNQFIAPKDSIDLDDLMINPDKYLDYKVNTELDFLKSEKIKKSKNALAEYLSSHPLFSDAKYADGRYYTVTEEKQRQLTSKMAMYNIYAQQSLEYPLLKWNDVGNVCEDWTVEELTKLAMEIDIYVTPLVEKQQEYEKIIQRAKTVEEIKTATLSFD